jgi:hypothetical protein
MCLPCLAVCLIQKGKEPSQLKYHGGTIFVDHASSFIFLVNQTSLRAGETLKAKNTFERLARTCGHNIKSFQADNMPFNSKEFNADLITKDQSISLSGVGIHHQNGEADRAIKTVTQWARSMLLHQILHWPDQARLDSWPCALEHAVYLWNHLPRKDTFIAPVELFTGATLADYSYISRAKVWGCPVYVLDPKLQDGKKIPKWDPRSRRGMFVGMSQSHSSTVGKILNHDDLFTTVPNGDTGGVLVDMPFNPQSWSKIVESGLERDFDPDDEAALGTNLIPSLDREWLSDEELPPTATRHNHNDDHPTLPIPPINIPVNPTPPIDTPVPSTPTPRSQSSEGDFAPIAVGDQEPPPTNISEGATPSSEEMLNKVQYQTSAENLLQEANIGMRSCQTSVDAKLILNTPNSVQPKPNLET